MLINPDGSSDLDENKFKDEYALDGNPSTYVMTQKAEEEYWTAEFQSGQHSVTRVRILNTLVEPENLAGSPIDIDGDRCGAVESPTLAGQWYEVICGTPLPIGESIFVYTDTETSLHFSMIEVFAKAPPKVEYNTVEVADENITYIDQQAIENCSSSPQGYYACIGALFSGISMNGETSF